MKRIGVVSYDIHANFTNYGSALQSWALNQVIGRLGYYPVMVDYCPDVLKDKDPLNPFTNMWDKDEESRRMCELTMPAIRENYHKFEKFYTDRFNRSKPYTRENFHEITDEVDSFVCGADTIFSPDEFGLDDGYFANYDCMKNNAVAYAASFGDPHFDEKSYAALDKKILNFRALGIRESLMIPYLKERMSVPVEKVIDPTLLLKKSDYEEITDRKRLVEERYLLYYSRRYNPKAEEYARSLARKNGWKIVEISLRATNEEKGHVMFYQAGVEEFLSLVKHAEFIVTNSFHGMIFSVQFQKQFVVFSRELCNTKIEELLKLFGLQDRMLVSGEEKYEYDIDYEKVESNIARARNFSVAFLKRELELLK